MKKIPKVIVLIETSRAFGRDFIKGITQYARKFGPWLFYTEPRDLKFSVSDLKEWQGDGIIMRNSPLAVKLSALRIPLISVMHYSQKNENEYSVKTNNEMISKLAAHHFIGLGFKNFAYCGFSNYDWSNERHSAYISYLKNHSSNKIFCFESRSQSTYKEWKLEQNRISNWLKTLPKPVGIFACNDDCAHHVLEACKKARLKVPEEIAVLGVDNDELICELCDPPLSSIALNTEHAGFETAALLDRLIKKKKIPTNEIIVNPTHIVKRHSSDMLSISDENVLKALLFIHANVENKITVKDVLDVTNLGRRSLENKFKNITGRSIMEELNRKRIELIISLLVDSDLSIKEMCNKFEFIGVDHFSRFFKKETGFSLREYRSKYKKPQ